MKKLILANPPLDVAETPLKYHKPLLPMGLAYLAGSIEDLYTNGSWTKYFKSFKQKRKGYRDSGLIKVFDNTFLSYYRRYSEDVFIEEINKFVGQDQDFYIGLSVLSDGVRQAKKLILRLNFEFPEAKIIVGGPHVTFFPFDFKKYKSKKLNVSYVVKNEGEKVLRGIVLNEFSSIEDVKEKGVKYDISILDVDYTDLDYKIIDGGQVRFKNQNKSKSIQEHILDKLSVPAFYLFEIDGELRYEPDFRYGLEAPAINLNTSRGCPHKCTFCTIPKLAPGYRTHSPERIFNMIEYLIKFYKIKSLFFREDNFMYSGGTVSGDRWEDVKDLCQLLISNKIKIKWAIEARSDNLLEIDKITKTPRIEILKNAGLTGIYMGVESASEEMLKLYVKGANVDQMKNAIAECHKRGIAVITTTIYSDFDLVLKREYTNFEDVDYEKKIILKRKESLKNTRLFLQSLSVKKELIEEYVLVGIPISTIYNVLIENSKENPILIEHFDNETRYIYPKGFSWYAKNIYNIGSMVTYFAGIGKK